jgi:hypothetical protein
VTVGLKVLNRQMCFLPVILYPQFVGGVRSRHCHSDRESFRSPRLETSGWPYHRLPSQSIAFEVLALDTKLLSCRILRLTGLEYARSGAPYKWPGLGKLAQSTGSPMRSARHVVVHFNIRLMHHTTATEHQMPSGGLGAIFSQPYKTAGCREN